MSRLITLSFSAQLIGMSRHQHYGQILQARPFQLGRFYYTITWRGIIVLISMECRLSVAHISSNWARASISHARGNSWNPDEMKSNLWWSRAVFGEIFTGHSQLFSCHSIIYLQLLLLHLIIIIITNTIIIITTTAENNRNHCTTTLFHKDTINSGSKIVKYFTWDQ